MADLPFPIRPLRDRILAVVQGGHYRLFRVKDAQNLPYTVLDFTNQAESPPKVGKLPPEDTDSPVM